MKNLKQLIEGADLKKIEHLSPSTCQAFRKCGYKVLFRKCYGIEENVSYAMTEYGQAMHEAINAFGIEYKNNKDLHFLSFVYDKFVEYWQEYHKRVTRWGRYGDSYESLLEEAEFAINDLQPILMPIFERDNYATEVEYDLRVEGLNRSIKCFADLEDYSTNTIIDLKFGRGLWGYSNSSDFKLNMATYAMGYEEKHGVFPKVYLLKAKWKKTNNKYKHEKMLLEDLQSNKSLNFKKEYIAYYQEMYRAIEKSIDNRVFIPAVDDDYLCKICGYRLTGQCDIVGF